MTDLEPIAPPLPARAPVDVLDRLREAIGRLDDVRRDLADAGDWESLAWGLDGLRQLKADLAIVEKDVEKDVARLMPSRQETVEHLGTLISRPVYSSPRWRSEELLAHLVLRAIFDAETGELRAATALEGAQLAASEIAACAPVTPSLGWRVTALRERDIDPDEWRHRDHKGESVQIVKAG